jgi:hypothetical protein
MPPDAIGIPGTLFLARDHVRIVAGRFEATHARLFVPGARSALPEHRAEMVAAVSGKRAKRYLKREHLLQVGRPALEYMTSLIHRRSGDWVRDVDRLHELLQAFGPDVMRGAFARAVAGGTIGAEYIEHYIADAVRTGQQELPL